MPLSRPPIGAVAPNRAGYRRDEWVAVHGFGGVGLSAVQIAVALGAQVVAIDVSSRALELAARLGAEATIEARPLEEDVAARVVDATGGGRAHLSLDAFGSPATCLASIRSLRKRGRHVQVGLLPPSQGVPAIPMDAVLSRELEILGSHGMAAHAYPELLALVTSGLLRPDLLVTHVLNVMRRAGRSPPSGRTPAYRWSPRSSH